MAAHRSVTQSSKPSSPPFAVVEESLRLLSCGPSPLALDGATITGLPDRIIPLGELRSRLLHPATPYAVNERKDR